YEGRMSLWVLLSLLTVEQPGNDLDAANSIGTPPPCLNRKPGWEIRDRQLSKWPVSIRPNGAGLLVRRRLAVRPAGAGQRRQPGAAGDRDSLRLQGHGRLDRLGRGRDHPAWPQRLQAEGHDRRAAEQAGQTPAVAQDPE